MNLVFNVQATIPRSFEPSELTIYLGAIIDVDGVPHREVATELKETFEKGWAKQYKDHVFPLSVLKPLVESIDKETMQPIINMVALAALLQSFGLKLSEPE